MATWKKLLTEDDLSNVVSSSDLAALGGDGLNYDTVDEVYDVGAGPGLQVNSTQLQVRADLTTIGFDTLTNTAKLEVKDGAITSAKLNSNFISGLTVATPSTQAGVDFIAFHDGDAGGARKVSVGDFTGLVATSVGTYTLSSDSTTAYDWADSQIVLDGPGTDTVVYLESTDNQIIIGEVTHAGEGESISFRLKEDLKIAKTLHVDYAAGASGSALLVDGPSVFKDSVSVGQNGTPENLTVYGDLIVQGTQTILNTEQLTVDDQVIRINDNATDAAPLSGKGGIEVGVNDTLNANFDYDHVLGAGGVIYQTGWRATKAAASQIIQYNGSNAIHNSAVMTMDYANTDDVPVAGDDVRGLGQMVFVQRSGAAVGEVYIRVD